MLDNKTNTQDFAKCEDCGLIERMKHINLNKHVCGKITDSQFIVKQNLKLKVGKHRFYHIKII